MDPLWTYCMRTDTLKSIPFFLFGGMVLVTWNTVTAFIDRLGMPENPPLSQDDGNGQTLKWMVVGLMWLLGASLLIPS